MLKWFQALMPREDKFFPLFNQHAAITLKGAEALKALLDGSIGVDEGCRLVQQHENEADAVAREVQLGVHRTLITPFDRGDIKELITLLDDAIDQMQKTVKAITLFEVKDFTPQMRELGAVIVQASQLTAEAVSLLPAMHRNAARLNALAMEITKVEDRSDELYDEGVRALYHASKAGDPMAYITGAEIYDHLEKIVDRLEDVANRISGILIEHL
jgi:predicted phosphate transport protein (TIGR00153 family)